MQTGGEKLNGILLRDQSLFVAQKIEFRAKVLRKVSSHLQSRLRR